MTEAVVQRSENLRFEPVATVDGSQTLRSGFWVGQVRDFTTSRTEPVSGAGVAGGDGGVENSVRVNSDERERVRGRKRERTGEREREESLPPVYELISEPLTQLNHLWSQNPSGQAYDQNTLPQGLAAGPGRGRKRTAARSFWYRPRRLWWPDESTAGQNVAGCFSRREPEERERGTRGRESVRETGAIPSFNQKFHFKIFTVLPLRVFGSYLSRYNSDSSPLRVYELISPCSTQRYLRNSQIPSG
ncbi:unnamed protein product [Prunus armeniaca]